MKVLVCGGRDFENKKLVFKTLDLFGDDITCIIHGCASGADTLAGMYAHEMGLTVLEFSADWENQGPKAGPLRNQQMLDEGKPDLVMAFPGGRGTEDMKRRAYKAGVRVKEVVGWPCNDFYHVDTGWACAVIGFGALSEKVNFTAPIFQKIFFGLTKGEVRKKIQENGWSARA